MVSKEIPFLGMLSKSNHDSAEGPWNCSILISFQAILLGVPMIVTPFCVDQPTNGQAGKKGETRLWITWLQIDMQVMIRFISGSRNSTNQPLDEY